MPQVRLLLQAVLPRRPRDIPTVLHHLRDIQQQNYAAYLSHRAHPPAARFVLTL